MRLLVAAHVGALAIVTLVGTFVPGPTGIVAFASVGLSQVSLLATWSVFGTARIPERIVGTVLAVGVVIACWHHVRNPGGAFNPKIVLFFALPAITVCGAALLLRHLGVRAVGPISQQQIQSGILQFTLRGFLLSTTVAAVGLVAIPRIDTVSRPGALSALSLICTAETFLALWFCLSPSRSYWRWSAIPLIVAIVLTGQYVEGWLTVYILSIAALISVATLFVVRYLGYRVCVESPATTTGLAVPVLAAPISKC